MLTFSRANSSKQQRDDLRKKLAVLWRQCETLLSQDLEQNIEYWRKTQTFYVRVPWQIYLLAISARLTPLRLFESHAAQKRLGSILDQVLDRGFRYPHSGLMISARTNAIIFEVIGRILNERSHQWLSRLSLTLDKVRLMISGRPFKTISSFVAFAVMAFAIWRWLQGDGTIEDLAPNLFTALLLLLAGLGKAR